jgi:Restriction endonuclease/Polymer-forming cytoskeletal
MFELLAIPTPSQQAQWTLDLLRNLEWHRFQELVGRLLHRAGFLPEVAWVRPDGATALTLVHPARPRQLEAVVQCPPWQSQEVDLTALHDLHQVVVEEGAQRGIYVTPGSFREEARGFARLKPIELVDGRDLLGTLQRMTSEERDYLLRMTTFGPYAIPSCPSCARKMELVDDGFLGQRQRDLIFRDNRFESGSVDCRHLMVKEGAEVVFMKSVTATSMLVQGKVTGNFVINGRLHIPTGGIVGGLVSARAIQLDPGGTLEAEARILNEIELAHIRPMPAAQVWRCPSYPKCRSTLPLR